jgi:hypothetical protein
VFSGHLNAMLKDAARHSGKLVDEAMKVHDPSISMLIRRQQYAESQLALQQVQADLWGGVDRTTKRGIAQAAERADAMWSEVNARLASALPGTVRAEFQATARHAVENIKSRYINSIDLSPTVYKNQLLSNGMVDRAVNRGILLNKSAAEIARDVRSLIQPDVQGGVSYAAKRLGRTELNNAFHTTTIRSAAAQPWVEGMDWHLSGSHPRTDICNEYADHGTYPSRLVPDKPHPQCLCYVTAVTPSDKEFLDKLMDGDYGVDLVP